MHDKLLRHGLMQVAGHCAGTVACHDLGPIPRGVIATNFVTSLGLICFTCELMSTACRAGTSQGATALQMLQRESRRMQRQGELRKVSAEEKAAGDEQRWKGWLARYHARLQLEANAGASAPERVNTMLSVNPR